MRFQFTKDKKNILLLAFTIFWMGMIFFFSSRPADQSAQLSSSISNQLLDVIGSLLKGNTPKFLISLFINAEHIVRKTAHFIEYFVLAIPVTALTVGNRAKRPCIMAVLVCCTYAVSDEIHQAFVPGRGPALGDVILDTFAAVIGTAVLALLYRRLAITGSYEA